MDSQTIDEVIINFVQENKCLYDKQDKNFKNILKKKVTWKQLSDLFSALYQVNLSAEQVEKRWSSLRDMFSREHRKQRLAPSGSGYTPTKEWELYKTLLFLLPHIAHRKTKTSFPLTQQLPSCSTAHTHDHNYDGFEEVDIDHQLDISISNDNLLGDETFTDSPGSSISSGSCLPQKVIPEINQFAKKRKVKDQEIEESLSQASQEISSAMKSIVSQINNQQPKDGYMVAIEEGLKYVSPQNKTQCLIEILQIIKKYENRK